MMTLAANTIAIIHLIIFRSIMQPAFAINAERSAPAFVNKRWRICWRASDAPRIYQPEAILLSTSRAGHDAQVFIDDPRTLERAVGWNRQKTVAMDVVKPAAPTQSLKPERETTKLKPQQTASLVMRP